MDDIREIDEDCWFGPDVEPTCRKIAEHARLIQEADRSHPIILSPDGRLMDGGHRLCKALLFDMKEISAVRFEVDPEPDYIVPASDNL